MTDRAQPGAGPAGQGFGAIVSRDPMVTVSKRSHFHQSPAGIGPAASAALGASPSLHVLFLAWSHERPEEARAAAADIAAAFADVPGAHVVVLANTAPEAAALRGAGLDAVDVNLLLAIDESEYRLADPDPDFPPCDAVYVAGLEPYKRHELAADVGALRLLYWRPSASDLARTRAMLPDADFANHRIGGGPHVLLEGARYCAAVQSARVGLCLSEVEGPMRASIEYALLGLPVVTTPARGGRLEFMDGAHVHVAQPHAGSVATAVQTLSRNRARPETIRASALERIAKERARVFELLTDRARLVFGTPIDAAAFGQPRDWGLWRTRSEERILALE